jgi:hypothetical protein
MPVEVLEEGQTLLLRLLVAAVTEAVRGLLVLQLRQILVAVAVDAEILLRLRHLMVMADQGL